MAINTTIGIHNQKLGKLGEDQACQFLEQHGYQIECRNFRCSLGEIDIIALYNKELVFFEVKSRSTFKFGTPSEIINLAKLRRMEQVAWLYLRNTHQEQLDWSIKVIEVTRAGCSIHELLL